MRGVQLRELRGRERAQVLRRDERVVRVRRLDERRSRRVLVWPPRRLGRTTAPARVAIWHRATAAAAAAATATAAWGQPRARVLVPAVAVRHTAAAAAVARRRRPITTRPRRRPVPRRTLSRRVLVRRRARRRVVRRRAPGSVEAARAARHRSRRAASLPARVVVTPLARTAVRTAVRAPSPMWRPRTVARRTVASRKLVTPRRLVEAAVVARWLVAPRAGLLVAPGRRPVAHLLLLRWTLRREALPICIVHGRPAGRHLAATWRRPVIRRARPAAAAARRRPIRASVALSVGPVSLVAAVLPPLVARVCHHVSGCCWRWA